MTLAEFYVYDGGNLLLVLDGSENVKNRYLSGPNQNQVLAQLCGVNATLRGQLLTIDRS